MFPKLVAFDIWLRSHSSLHMIPMILTCQFILCRSRDRRQQRHRRLNIRPAQSAQHPCLHQFIPCLQQYRQKLVHMDILQHRGKLQEVMPFLQLGIPFQRLGKLRDHQMDLSRLKPVPFPLTRLEQFRRPLLEADPGQTTGQNNQFPWLPGKQLEDTPCQHIANRPSLSLLHHLRLDPVAPYNNQP